jgi:hypothetical protein
MSGTENMSKAIGVEETDERRRRELKCVMVT